ncbi:MAG: TrkH family potassium uptake protein [Candidatus Eisenbacteria sp.]|nr:TrkH family potassium uptake protein [Candidatus Eisenbacteria bacterium]
MNLRVVCRFIGIIVLLVGASMVFSLVWALYFGETVGAFLYSMAIAFAAGAALLWFGRKSEQGDLLRKEGMLVVGLGWLLSALFGCLPFILSGIIANPISAYFETMSGFTTTGATVLSDIEILPKGILFWRSFTHWLGGMGIIVLFVAILPQVGAGGKVLFKSEAPGPSAEGLKPRVRQTATRLWIIYVAISMLETVVLRIEGMTLFDSLCHTFGTMATGGFSTKSLSIGHYDSTLIEFTIIAFMILAATNFNLYYRVLRGKRWAVPLDAEWRIFMGIMVAAILLVTLNLRSHAIYSDLASAVRYASFQVVSILTTTGYVSADFDQWPSFSKLLLVLLMFVGGCAGSTGGSMKVIRVAVVFKRGFMEIRRIFRPQLTWTLKMGGKPVSDQRTAVILSFVLIFVGIFAIVSCAMALMGLDLATAVTCSIASLGNIGPGLAGVGAMVNYADIPLPGQFILAMCMVLGRLELFAILVMFVPSFWKE